MRHHDQNDRDRNHYSRDERRKTVQFLGTEIAPAQFWILACFMIPYALAARFGFFEYLRLGPFETVALAAPFFAVALALAFIRTEKRYLYMVLTEKLRHGKSKQTVALEEDGCD